MSKLIAIFLLILLPVYSACAAPSPSEAPRRIRIGLVTDLVGRGAFWGTQSVRGAKFASEEISSSAAPVELIIEDSAGNNTQAITAATKLIEVDDVDGLICDLTPVCQAVSPKSKASKIPLIYQSPSRAITQQNEFAFRNFLDYVEACRVVAHAWKQKGLSRIGLLAPNFEFGDLCQQGLKLEFANHYSYRYDPGDDLRSAVSLFRTHDLQAVMQVGYEAEFLSWFRITREQKYSPVQGFLEIMLSPTLISGGSESIEGATIVGYQNVPQEFLSALNAKFPSQEQVNIQGAALAYNAVKNLHGVIQLLRRSPELSVRQAFLKTNASPLLGFRGWSDLEAEYPAVVKEWRLGALH